jgi:phenylacetate-CoA ligase
VNPSLLRHGVFPLLDAFNRTRIGQVLAFLEASQWRPYDELAELQRRKLRDALAWAGTSPTYREIWKTAPASRRASSVHPELDGLPIIDKEDLRSRLSEFPVPGYRGRVLRIQTSGSTGKPTVFLRSGEQESWFWALRYRMWEWAGWRFGEPYVAINLNVRTAWKKRLQDAFLGCTYLTYNVENIDSERIVRALEASGATHINAFGSTLLALAGFVEAHGVRAPRLRALTVTGDNLYQAQRDLIERAFGLQVTDYYGAGGEGVHLASQCERHDGYHVHMENAVVELITEGRSSRPGEVGRVVVTQLDNRAMPLVRYDLGDVATAADGRACACGRSLPIGIESLSGRACDLIRVPGGGVLLPQFFFIGAFKKLERVRSYQVVQEREDRITVRIVPEDGCDRPTSERNVREEIERATKGALGVDFAWVQAIELSGLGKLRPVISKLAAAPSNGAAR